MMDDTANDVRAQQIAVGSALPGLDGTLWRLLGRFDVELLSRWCTSEKIRGTPPEQMFDALSIWLSSAVVIGASQVGRVQMQSAARDILSNTATLVHKDIVELKERKKVDSILRNDLRVIEGKPSTDG